MPRQDRRSRLVIAAIAVVAVLIVIRAALPYAIKSYVNHALHNLEGYDGNVDDIDLFILGGGIAANGVSIYKESLSRKTPLFQAETMAANIKWLPLFTGSVIASGRVERPEIIVNTPKGEKPSETKKEGEDVAKDTKKAAKEANTNDMLDIIPFRIDEFVVHNGSVTYVDENIEPKINVAMKNIEIKVENLTNSRRLSDTLMARAEVTGVTTGDGQFQLQARMNPVAKRPTFNVSSKLMALKVKALNPITNKYAKFDFEKGELDLVTEVAVVNGAMNGYVKPLLRDVEILGSGDKKRDKDGLLRRFWESIVGATEEIAENQPISQSGTKIPIKGQIDTPDPSISAAVVAVLRNAFVQALLPNYEGPTKAS